MELKDLIELNKFDYNDFLLLKYLEKVGPRDGIARAYKLLIQERKMKISYGQSYYKIKKLIEQGIIDFDVKIDIFRLGLQGVIVLFEVNPKYSEIFEKAIQLNPTLVYYSRFYGSINGYVTQFTIPFGYYYKLNDFLSELKNLRIVNDFKIYNVDNYLITELGMDWYDFENKKPLYKWDELLNEIKNAKINEEASSIKPFYEPDEIDLKILELIERKSLISLTEVSKKLGISIPAIKYHYDKHLIQSGIIKSFLIKAILFKKFEMVSLHYAILDFTSDIYTKKFAEAIKNKHFVWQATSVNSYKSVTITLHLPHTEYLNFIRLLWKLVEEGILKDFIIGTLDTKYSMYKVLPYQLYKNGQWSYPHEEIIKNLHMLVATQELKQKP